MKALNHIGRQFSLELKRSFLDAEKKQQTEQDSAKIHVSGVGASITQGYEKLRNASELSDESLLLRKAIGRYFKRLILTNEPTSKVGRELIDELTMAGYIQNDSIVTSVATKITKIVNDFLPARQALSKTISGDQLNAWTINVMAVQIESLLNDHSREVALVNLAYNYFLASIDTERLFGRKPVSYEAMLLAAIQKTLLKSNDASVRYDLLTRYQIAPTDLKAYREFNHHIDKMFENKDSDVLSRFVDRHEAEFRVLSRLIDENHLPDSLENFEIFHSNFQTAIGRTYKTINANINRGVWRSVLFLIITKFILGVAAEVPYDYLVSGAIIWLPLIVNLIFPPVYMILLRFTLIMPGPANSRNLDMQIDRVLYTDEFQPIFGQRKASKGYGVGFQVLYTVVVLGVALGVGYLLWTIGFAWLHLLVFYIFVSAASFLAFRLSRTISEVETIEARQSFVTTLRDFLYMPFVAIGQWVSEKYAKINVISRALDIAIELPLKA
ncbi:MAG: hypothetical protein LBL08_00985, partial [Candidatus Nomurabacteria bacterium]|nr:hypothetical protein [Candidatus Nomurabacteria bacterium]